MMSEIKSFNDYVEENTPHYTAELICVNCKTRWVGVWPADVLLKDISCPSCREKGYVITTGQMFPEEIYGDT